MGNLRACFAIALLALAACGSDHQKDVDAAIKIADAPPDMKVFEDAPPPMFDFSCMGNAAPTTATANITLSGTVQRISLNGTMPSVDPLQGASVKACKAGTSCTGMNQYGMTATSAMDGSWSIGPFATSSMPIDGFLAMTGPQTTPSRPTDVYPPSPLVADQANIPVLTFDPTLISLLGQFTACTQMDATNGLIVLAVTDCANAPITDSANTTITIKQNNAVVTTTQVVDLSMLGSQAAGTYLVCNVPENAVTNVGVTYKTMTLRAHDVGVVKAHSSATIVRPGY